MVFASQMVTTKLLLVRGRVRVVATADTIQARRYHAPFFAMLCRVVPWSAAIINHKRGQNQRGCFAISLGCRSVQFCPASAALAKIVHLGSAV